MLLVKTKLQQSPIHGIGLFADEFIPKGTTTWRFEPAIDLAFTHEDIEKMPDLARTWIRNYIYFDRLLDKYVLCADDTRFMNHSFNGANTISNLQFDVATRDIAAGEELLCNYTDFDEHYFEWRGIDPSHYI
jgi:SET domain-containing protein